MPCCIFFYCFVENNCNFLSLLSIFSDILSSPLSLSLFLSLSHYTMQARDFLKGFVLFSGEAIGLEWKLAQVLLLLG